MGIGHVIAGMHRRGYDVQLTQYDERGWRGTFYVTGMEHSATSATASAWEQTHGGRFRSLRGRRRTKRRLTAVLVISDYRGYRIEIVAQLVDGAWNAGVRIRRALSEMKPHVEQVTCRKPSAMEAEQSGEIWAKRWVDRQG